MNELREGAVAKIFPHGRGKHAMQGFHFRLFAALFARSRDASAVASLPDGAWRALRRLPESVRRYRGLCAGTARALGSVVGILLVWCGAANASVPTLSGWYVSAAQGGGLSTLSGTKLEACTKWASAYAAITGQPYVVRGDRSQEDGDCDVGVVSGSGYYPYTLSAYGQPYQVCPANSTLISGLNRCR